MATRAEDTAVSAGSIPRKKRSLEEGKQEQEGGEYRKEQRRQRQRPSEDAPQRKSEERKEEQTPKDQQSDAETTRSQSQQQPPPAWMGKRNYFFRKWSSDIRKQLQMDEVASFSITACDIADRMATDLKKLQSSPSERWSVIDGTACVGGNTIAFSSVFEHVYAVELDETRCSMLRNNLKVLGCENVTVKCGDFVSVFPTLPDSELLFLDPEWGGPEYMNAEKVSLNVGDQPLSAICDNAFATRPGLRVIALKLPVNFDLEAFTTALRLRQRPTVYKYRKMIMVVLKRSMWSPPST